MATGQMDVQSKNLEKTLSSRIPQFYKLSIQERQNLVAGFVDLTPQELSHLISDKQNDQELLGKFIENPCGTFSLPLGIAPNFLIDNEEYIIPMAVEESSVLAACSYGAKLCRTLGGFRTSVTLPITTAQIQVHWQDKSHQDIEQIVKSQKEHLQQVGHEGFDKLLARGGGIKEIRSYPIDKIKCTIINLDVHTCDAMGANIVNTMAESIGAYLRHEFNLNVGLQILTNLSIFRRAKAECEIPASAFKTEQDPTGLKTIQKIEQAYQFARYDIFRAATHNKGIMNGIDPVVIATGNDWRAVEASAHAWAAHDGMYKSMSYWKVIRDDVLYGCLDLPIPVGTVGGVTKLHPLAKVSLKLLKNPGAQKLAGILACVGLAQNLSAMRALSVEGIQSGHMRMHAKNIEMQKNHDLHKR